MSDSSQGDSAAVPGNLRIVIIGKTGVGKSETGNSILGRKDFDSSPGGDLNTYNCARRAAFRFDRNLLVVDTPGILEQDRNFDVKAEIRTSIDMAYPGPHAFLFCVNMGRMTVEDNMAFEAYRKCFGPEMFKFTTVVFTHVDQWRQNMEHKQLDPDLKGFINTIPKFAKGFMNACSGMPTFFNNRLAGTDMDTQVTSLIEKIEENNRLIDGIHYTKDMLGKAINAETFKKYYELVFNRNNAFIFGLVSTLLVYRFRR